MTPERWQLVAQTFEAVLEVPAHERTAFLAQAASRDPALQLEVESLLAQDARLDHAAATAPTKIVGERVGAYRILRLIGEGGMGAVYEAARDDQAFERHVAIKLLQPGLLSRQLIQRFLLERNILARLNHPAVAALLDAGATPGGQHYLVMEYVEGGVPINLYCRQRAIDLAGRLRLFQGVCDAVQYAHQNLVLHRDLKPQNILVTPDGAVKLLDFGIAKLMRAGDAAADDLTLTDLAPMTPAYASPEQVLGEPVTTASDVYSLGVILYELIAGTRPYGTRLLTRTELERAVCHTEPKLPSVAALTAEPQPASSVQMARQLSGDLDAIVMMALRKEPARRYQSPSELRDDLARHLGGRPVHARRNTLSYRAGKLLRRHRLAFAAVAAVILVIAGGIAATLAEARIAHSQRALAERHFSEIRKLANSFLFEFDTAISDLAGATAARQLVVRKSLEYLTALARESQDDPQLQTELATAYERVAGIQGNPTLANLGDRAGALQSYREALRIWTSLAARPNQAAAARSHIPSIHQSLGDVLSDEQYHEEALAEYRSALSVLDPSPQRSLQKFVLMGRIGTELAMLGRREEGAEWGRKAVEEARALLPDGMSEEARHEVATLYARAGKALLRAGAIDAAVDMHQEEISMCRNLVDSVAPEKNGHYRRDLAIAYRNLGDAFAARGQFREALPLFNEARPIQEALLLADAANSQIRMELSVTYSKISEALIPLGDLAGAERERNNDLRLGERLLQDDASSAAYRRMYSYSLAHMGALLRQEGKTADARRYFLRQADVLHPLETQPDKLTQRQLLTCYRALAELEANPKASLPYWNKALVLAQTLGDAPSAQAIRQSLAALPQ